MSLLRRIGFLWLAGACCAFAAEPNTLTQEEIAAGWQSLFDGRAATNWRVLGKDVFPRQGWLIEDGCLKKQAKVYGGDLVTRDKFTDFDFQWEWRISTNGNNGIKYFVTENPRTPGHEYQLLDDARTRNEKSSTGAFYTIIAPRSDKPLKTPGQWNHSRIVVKGNHVEHWLNGMKIVEYQCGSEAVKLAAAQSKYKNVKDYGTKVPNSHILLTDHRDETWFRNLKIRRL